MYSTHLDFDRINGGPKHRLRRGPAQRRGMPFLAPVGTQHRQNVTAELGVELLEVLQVSILQSSHADGLPEQWKRKENDEMKICEVKRKYFN